MAEGTHASELVEEALEAVASRRFDLFDDAMRRLCELPWDEAVSAVDERWVSILQEGFGTAPTYDQMIRVSKGVFQEIEQAEPNVPFNAYTVESAIRSFYGEPELLKGAEGESVLLLQLLVGGILLCGPASGS